FWNASLGIDVSKNSDIAKIKEYVLSNKRENIIFGRKIQKLQKRYAEIIFSDDPRIRASLQHIYLNLYNMYITYCFSGYNSSP
ncbi:14614_t:CDS:2, partial [Funneliformis mosseae]